MTATVKSDFRWAFVGDLQMPYQDDRAVALFMQVMKAWRPHAIDLVGDIDDQLEYSSFSDGTTDEFFSQLKKAKQEDGETDIDFRMRVSPLPYVKEGAKGVREFLTALRNQHKKADIHYSLGNHECFSMEGHRVVTRNGFKSYDEISIGDEVLSVNDDGARCWQPVEKVHLYPDDDSMLYKFDNSNIRGEFTENHRFIYKAGYKSENFREDVAKDFVKRWGGVFTTAASNPDADNSLTDDEIKLLAWCYTDSSVSGGQWALHQSEPKHTRPLELLGRLGVSYRDTSRQRETTEICGKTLKERPKISHDIYFSQDDIRWSTDTHYRLPEEVWSMSERQVELFINELQYTDGTQATGGTDCRVIYCSNEAKRDELRILFAMNGIQTSETEYAPGYWRINAVIKNNQKTDISRAGGIPKRVKSRGVWCLTVPNGRFFVEAFGAMHLTGNSRVFKYVDKKMPEYLDEVTPDLLWDVDKLRISWQPYELPPMERFETGIHVHHGATTTTAGLAVKGDIDNYNVSLVRGHDHRGGVVYKSYPMTGQSLVGMGTGHMCNPKAYGLRYTVNPSWELGFGIGHVVDGETHLQFIHIDPSYTCVVDGKVFRN